MLEKVYTAVKAIVDANSGIDDTDRKRILDACKNEFIRRKLITRKEALEILEVSPPTFLKFIREKKVREIRLSPRKIRFDKNQIIAFANTGIPAGNQEVAR